MNEVFSLIGFKKPLIKASILGLGLSKCRFAGMHSFSSDNMTFVTAQSPEAPSVCPMLDFRAPTSKGLSLPFPIKKLIESEVCFS